MKKLGITLLLLLIGIPTLAQNFDQWQFGYRNDKFGDPTEDSLFVYNTWGEFANSSTQGSKLKVEVIANISQKKATIHMWEYGNMGITWNVDGTQSGPIHIKTPAKQQKLKGAVSEDEYVIASEDLFYFLFKSKAEEIKFYIPGEEFSSWVNGEYRFSVESLGHFSGR